jgi:uncharacterized protein (TIRG00374 family)
VRGLDWRQVWSAIVRARPIYLWCAGSITVVSCSLRAMRWRILLNAEDRLGFRAVFRAMMAGYVANNFLPARAGEVLRSVLIARCSKLSNTYVLTTALSERLTDVIAVVLAAALALFTVHPKPLWLADLSRGMLFVSAAGALAIAILPHTSGLIETILGKAPLPHRIRQSLVHLSGEVLLGLRAFHQWGRLAGFAMLTAVIWSLDGISLLIIGRALGLEIHFPVAMLLLTAMALGSALPSTPGYLGIYQFAAVMVLGSFGIQRDQALAYSVVAQAVNYVVIAALGLPAVFASRSALTAAKYAAAEN